MMRFTSFVITDFKETDSTIEINYSSGGQPFVNVIVHKQPGLNSTAIISLPDGTHVSDVQVGNVNITNNVRNAISNEVSTISMARERNS